MTVGLIGYGRFGRFAARHLAQRVDVLVHDPASGAGTRRIRGVRFVSRAEAASQELVILAVPISSLRTVLQGIRPHLRRGALVCDVCAVKSGPVQWMRRSLPRGVAILGTHPLFGPDSAARTIRGKTIVLCPARISPSVVRRVRRSLVRAGLRTVVMTPRQHDRLMAETIFLTQAVGRLVDRAGLRRHARVTGNYDSLLRIIDTVRHDTDELFADMVRHSTESRRVLALLDLSFRSMKSLVRRAGR